MLINMRQYVKYADCSSIVCIEPNYVVVVFFLFDWWLDTADTRIISGFSSELYLKLMSVYK